MTLPRLVAAVFALVGLGMLAVAILVPDAWFEANVNCGNVRNPRSPCQAGEAQALLLPLGAGFAIGGALLFGLGELMRSPPSPARLACRAPAIVLSVAQSQRRFGSITVSRGHCEVRLRVHPAEGAPFETRLDHSALGPVLERGAQVTVGYEPDQPGDVALVSVGDRLPRG
jgi:hypothetical protein